MVSWSVADGPRASTAFDVVSLSLLSSRSATLIVLHLLSDRHETVDGAMHRPVNCVIRKHEVGEVPFL